MRYSVIDSLESDDFASVYQSDDDPKKWTMQVNLASFYLEDGSLDTRESIHMLIHEFVHIFTLSGKQLQLVDENTAKEELQESCKTYFISEECMRKSSYLASFTKKFWTQEMLDAVWQDEREDLASDYSGRFVSDYAGTNPVEDIAETFTHFVLHDRPNSSTQVSDQKVFFLGLSGAGETQKTYAK